MVDAADPSLRRFWFPVAGRHGIGITATSERHATMLAKEVARQLGWSLADVLPIADVDIDLLDGEHVLPKIGAPRLFGIWYPPFELEAPDAHDWQTRPAQRSAPESRLMEPRAPPRLKSGDGGGDRA